MSEEKYDNEAGQMASPGSDLVNTDTLPTGDGDSKTGVLQRYINFLAIANFAIVILASWESLAFTFQFALLNGGPASIFYGSILALFGTTAIGLSLAELASIDPTVGAQYRWSANFAPGAPRFWGLIQGWITVAAWCFASAGGPPSLLANIVLSLAAFNDETYAPARWHTSLVMMAVAALSVLGNLWFRRALNLVESLGGALHVALFVVYIAVLASMGTRSSDDFVFRTLVTDVSGWTDPGVSWSLGLLTVTFALSGPDSVLHMSDEVKHVRTRVPQSIIITCVSNALMLLIFSLVLLLYLEPADDGSSSLTAATLPLLDVLLAATRSRAAVTALVAPLALTTAVASFNMFASVSRLVWAFAGDGGLPCSAWLAVVDPRLGQPLRALGVVAGVSVLLSLVYVGSATAFNALISLSTLGLYASYVLPVLFLLVRKLGRRGAPPVPFGPVRMGRWGGVVCNVVALGYLLFILVWVPFPSVLPVDGDTMNYAGPIFGGTVLLALVDWVVWGRKRFQMPVKKYE